MRYLDAPLMRHAIADHENGPASVATEERALRHKERVVDFFGHDRRVDAESVTKRRPPIMWRDEIDHDPDALFLDAESGDFREGARLDETHSSVESLGSAPMLDRDSRAGTDRRGVRRQHVDRNLQIGGIADLEQRLAAADRRFALANDP